jgi:small-conductance mechanosensitive channel|tara:strand:+ start:5279 stop:6133 length:855 start_codon:yes stop_codon:yes gene_type:complete
MSWNEFFNYELLHIGSKSFQVWNVLLSVVVIAVSAMLLWFVKRIVENPRSILTHVDKKRRHSIYLIVKYFVWVISFLLFIEVLGFSVSILLGASAALLVGIGFGLQQIFADLVSGLFLLFEGTIKIGDVVQDDDGVIGKVTEINLRSSEMVTRDNVVVIVPNSKFVSEKVINWSHNQDSVRFLVEIGVAYRSDVEEVMVILQRVMDENNMVEKSPSSFVRFINFGDSSLDFQLIFWTKDPFTVENLKSDLRRSIHAKLKENGISIPFPQRDIHIISNPEKKDLK